MLKRILFVMLICFCNVLPAFGQQQVMENSKDNPYIGKRVGENTTQLVAQNSPKIEQTFQQLREEEALRQSQPRAVVQAPPAPTIDYISDKVIPLDAKERIALELSNKYQAQNSVKPYIDGKGKLIFVYGVVRPSIIGTPFNVCDVELQQGELINEVMVGDSARWQVETATSGGNTPHLLIKPVDAGLETSAVITTNRRVYHLRLVSQRIGHTPYIGFSYPEDNLKILNAELASKMKAHDMNKVDTVDGQTLDLSKLNFNFTIKGKASWKPIQVFDDGRQTFIKFPSKAATAEMPVLLVRKDDKEILVNYRVKDNTMVVDGLFSPIILIIGVGSDQETVEIKRN